MKVITSVEPLVDFIRFREEEDPIWRGSLFQEIQRRFSKGDICFAAVHETTIVSTIYVTYGGQYFSELGYYLPFPNHVLGLIDFYTLRRYRQQGYLSMVFQAIISNYIGSTFSCIYSFVSPDNIPSLITHDRIELNHIVLYISMKQRFGLRTHFVSQMDTYINTLFELQHLT